MKKNYFLVILVLLITSMSFNSCKDDSDGKPHNNNTYYTQAGNVSTLKKEAIQYIAETVTGNHFYFDGNTPDEVIPKVGTCILIPMSEKTPYGFLGRVTSIEKGDQIKVITENVPLDEAFENLSIDTTFNFVDAIDGVYDEDGNPIEYEKIKGENLDTRAGGSLEWDKEYIKMPIKNEQLGEFTVGGSVIVGFKDSKFDIDNNNGLKYLNMSITPYVSAKVNIETTIKEKKAEYRTKRLRMTGRVVAGPLIIPVTVYCNLICGAKGEIKSSLTLQYNNSSQCYIRYANKHWDSGCVPVEESNNAPWAVSQFDVKGEIYGGVEIGFLVGLYTAKSGIGINTLPKFYIEAEASISSLDPFINNPKVTYGGKLESSVYCVAELFGKTLGKYELKLPEFSFFKKSMYLLPEFRNFTATGSASSGEISYQTDSKYFLQYLGVKTGTTVYKSDKTTELNTYYPTHSSIDQENVYSYNVNVDGLKAGNTYYAAPIISWLAYKWVGEKREFSTEASYNLGFRCINQSYDNIFFSFSLNDITGNRIDITMEANDYSGELMRVHITAQYDANTQILKGLLDFYFYNDPGQKRQDGFTVALTTDDSGYVPCDKVIDNEGCYAALRIYRTASSAAKKNYAKPIIEDDCNIGLFNKNYSK